MHTHLDAYYRQTRHRDMFGSLTEFTIRQNQIRQSFRRLTLEAPLSSSRSWSSEELFHPITVLQGRTDLLKKTALLKTLNRAADLVRLANPHTTLRNLPVLLFMTHLPQALFALVGRHFMAFALLTTWHCALRYLFWMSGLECCSRICFAFWPISLLGERAIVFLNHPFAS